MKVIRSVLPMLLIAGCPSKSAPGLSAEDRENAMTAAKQCTDTIDSLSPNYQLLGPKLAATLKMDRAEAQRLMRDSIELLISTREMLCNLSVTIVDDVLAKSPRDEQVGGAHKRVEAALARLATARAAYDALLGATSADQPPVDQAALLDRFSRALLGN